MDQAQLQQLLNGIQGGGGGGSKKLTNLESTLPTDWRIWRSHFTTTCAINGWGDLRARRELKAAMLGEACRLTADINVETVGLTLEAVLTSYEGRFLPAAAGTIARAEFGTLGQHPNETIVQYHSRARDLFTRAYPEVELANVNTSNHLIGMFALGLANTEVSRHVLDKAPATYEDACREAQSKGAVELALAAKRKMNGGGGGSNHFGAAVNGMNGGNEWTTQKPSDHLTCWACNTKGHRKSECPSRNNNQGQNPPQQRGGGRGGGGRGRGRGRGRGGYSATPRASALTTEEGGTEPQGQGEEASKNNTSNQGN